MTRTLIFLAVVLLAAVLLSKAPAVSDVPPTSARPARRRYIVDTLYWLRQLKEKRRA